jgi:ribosomal protein S18 acetylase RimI-like enzyme
VVLVAADDTGIHGIGEFVAEPGGRSAELALVVEDAFQSRGMGPRLYRQLEEHARSRRISAFTGDMQYTNARAQRLLRRSGTLLSLQPGGGSLRFHLAVMELASDAA